MAAGRAVVASATAALRPSSLHALPFAAQRGLHTTASVASSASRFKLPSTSISPAPRIAMRVHCAASGSHTPARMLLALARARMAHTSAPRTAAAVAPSSMAQPLPAADADIDGSTDHANTADDVPKLTHPVVAYHLFALAALVYAIVVVGGLTRLTESGLSITEWNPGFKGVRLPSTDEEWHAEWDKYKLTPEFIMLNQRMSLDDFKSIYMWEWAHRVLGRVIGVAFVVPAAYFLARPGWVAKGTRWKLIAIGAGIGFQGALGWFMVKSGLSDPTSKHASPQAQAVAEATGSSPPIPTATMPGSSDLHSTSATSSNQSSWTPRVSHFRLAAHLGTAFLVYLGMLHTGLSILRDWKLANGQGTVAGVPLDPKHGQAATPTLSSPSRQRVVSALNHPAVRRYARSVRHLAIFVFCTAMSGALVAGLDAGLVYNEWPTMGGDGRLAPPADELLDDRYALRSASHSSSPSDEKKRSYWRLWVGNTFNNPVTVQLVHRTLATTSFVAVLALAWRTRSLRRTLAATGPTTRAPGVLAGSQAVQLPPLVPRLAGLACAAVTLQASLGITTLLYLVPIPLASAHQAGSLALLSVLIALSAALRRPGASLVRAIEAGERKVGSAVWREQTRSGALARVVSTSTSRTS